MNRCPDRQFTLAESPSSRESLPTEAVTWLEQFYAENIPRDDFSERKVEVLNEIEQTGTYHQQPVELAFGAKVAWRNSVRCVGRLYWKSLIVRDCRHLRTAEDVFAALLDHLRIATNRGMVLPVITIFAPVVGNQTGIRIWNHQLVGYAGYTESNHHIIGDPLNVEFTRQVQSLGWRNQTNGSFDLLPIVIQMEAEQPKWFELPQDVVLEIPLRHPDFLWFEDLDLKWYTTPVISDMRLEIGGLSYSAAPFGGWYVGSEIGARDLADVGRYNLLPTIAERMN